jgi:formylglycine-generating enzyme
MNKILAHLKTAWRFFATIACFAVVQTTIAQQIPHSFELDTTGRPNRINWQTVPGVRYDLLTSTNMDVWTRVTGYPRTAEGLSMSHSFNLGPKAFFRIGSIDDDFALIPAGTFQMGDSFAEGATWELPVHTVNVSAFHMARHETTTELWKSVRAWAVNNGYTDLPEGNGSLASKGDNHPIHLVSWYDAVKWCNARSEKDRLTPCYKVGAAVFKTGTDPGVTCNFAANGYRLPTEAEWEKAARGGMGGKRFPWGDTINHSHANYQANSSAFSFDTSGYTSFTNHPTYEFGNHPFSSPVGSFAPNGYGLYDMAGNMWEWCWDWHDSAYYGSSPSNDPQGPASGIVRVYRGGGWNYGANFSRAAARGISNPGSSSNGFGFRVARSSAP